MIVSLKLVQMVTGGLHYRVNCVIMRYLMLPFVSSGMCKLAHLFNDIEYWISFRLV